MENYLSEDEKDLVLVTCNSCIDKDEQLHKIINDKKKGGGRDVLVQCESCSSVHTIELRPPRAISLDILSLIHI